MLQIRGKFGTAILKNKLENVHMPQALEIPSLAIYPKESSTSSLGNRYTVVHWSFIYTVNLIVTKIWKKSKCLPLKEWKGKTVVQLHRGILLQLKESS